MALSLGVSRIILFESSMKSVQVHWKSDRFQGTRRGSCNASSGDLKRKGRLICCGKLKLWAGRILGARRIERETPCCGRTPHSGPRAHMALWCTPADREPGWLCAHYASRGESEWVSEWEWEGSRRLAPQACRLPRPQHSTNESNGNGWAHTGGQGLLCRAKRSRGKRPEERRWGVTSRVSWSRPVPLQSFCKHVLVLPFDDGTCLEYLYKPACRYMCTSCFIYTSCTHDVSLPDTPENFIKPGTLHPAAQLNANFCWCILKQFPLTFSWCLHVYEMGVASVEIVLTFLPVVGCFVQETRV